MAGRVLLPSISCRNARHLARSSLEQRRCNHSDFTRNDDDDLMDPLLARGSLSDFSASVHYQSIYDSSEFTGNLRNRREVMRKRLRSHFMTPYEKYKNRGRKPWKLLLQLLKLVMITIQVCHFASELFSVVSFLDDTGQAFDHLFLLDSNDSDYAIYTKEQFFLQVRHSVVQFSDIKRIAVGTFGFPSAEKDGADPMIMCIYKYINSSLDPEKDSYEFSRKTDYSCHDLLPPRKSDNLTSFIKRNKLPESFESTISITLTANISSFHVPKAPRKPACYKFNVTILFDNSNHDGRVPVTLDSEGTMIDCSGNSSLTVTPDYQRYRTVHVFVDILTILLCFLSMTLCLRSLFRQLKLVKATRRFFIKEIRDSLTYYDCLDLINLWFVLILISDSCAILGSVGKILIDMNNQQQYSFCSVFLGIAVLLTWCGLLSYLGHFRKYNILLVTLKAAAPSVLRFCVCGSLLYFGFMFCGWIVLGPYHVKFRNLSTVSECMFSLINGDDMFMTFSKMDSKNYAIWVFSKIYLYTFISLFIYVVLSLFIGIISDTYERIKDWGHPPCTKLQRFVHGNNCQRCNTEHSCEDQENEVASGSITD
ncbi:mucolipin-3-like [Acropora palmata]|uniref:mucolipin-3-like n=1 Tax=Acropora palmata TaxID=6131 RepID=UPI003DA09FFF